MKALLPALCALAVCATARADEPPVQTVQVLGHYDTAIGSSNAASEGAVTARLIASRPALRSAELLEFVPGVIVTQHSGDGKANQYFLRGFNLDHGTDFATFVDGMPVNMASHAHGQGYSDLNFLIPELVRRIDYRKGPYFADDGDFASAGSARLTLMDTVPQGQARVTLGAHGHRRVLLADSTPLARGQLLGALEVQHHDGPWQVPQGLRRHNGWLRLSETNDTTTRSVTAMVYDARWTATDQIPARAVERGALTRFGSLDASDGGRTQRFSLSAAQRVSLPDGQWQANAYVIASRLNLWSNFTYRLDDPVNGDQFEQAERRRVFGASASRRWDVDGLGREHQVTLGAELRHDRVAPVGLYTTAQRRRLATTQESQLSQTRIGLYSELASGWTPWLRSVAGLRADAARFDVQSSVDGNSGRSSDHIVSPKLSLIAGPWAKTELFVNAGRGFHSNDARGTVASVSPRDGMPIERVPGLVASRGAELGLRTEWVPGLQSSLALWRLDLDSELVFVGDAGDTEASRASRRHGIEWSNHWTLGRAWRIDLDLALSKARFEDTAPEGRRVPGAVNRVMSFGLDYAGDPWFGHVQLRHFGPRVLVEDGSRRSASTTLVSLRAGCRVASNVTLTADVFNLTNRRASDIDYLYTSRLDGEPAGGVEDRHFHPVEPRTVRVTLSASWR